jgi:hypothetical protein
MTAPQTEPTPIAVEPLATDEQIRVTLKALQTAYDALPLDDDLPSAAAVAANMVRRSSLGDSAARLRMAAQRIRELTPTPVLLRDWIDTLTACHVDLTAQLTAMEEEAKHSLRAGTLANQLRYALRDVANGPDMVGSGEFMPDILVEWFHAHHVSPLPGESGIFSGRGGLHSAKLRHADSVRALASATADLESSLAAAQALLAIQSR